MASILSLIEKGISGSAKLLHHEKEHLINLYDPVDLYSLEWRYSAVAIATKSSAIFSVAGQSTNVDENLSVENQEEDVEVQDIDHNSDEETA
nr:3488_t:CDS:2 [Entrophospora candida]